MPPRVPPVILFHANPKLLQGVNEPHVAAAAQQLVLLKEALVADYGVLANPMDEGVFIAFRVYIEDTSS